MISYEDMLPVSLKLEENCTYATIYVIPIYRCFTLKSRTVLSFSFLHGYCGALDVINVCVGMNAL
jgi:uncharacterized membrane protein YesL